jgi:hypothetical protein
MIGYFLIALALIFIVVFIVILKKRTAEDLSESADSEDDSVLDSVSLGVSEIIDDDGPEVLPDAVDLTSDLPPPQDQGDLGASTSFAVASAAEYLANNTSDVANVPDRPSDSGSSYDSGSNSYDSGSSGGGGGGD